MDIAVSKPVTNVLWFLVTLMVVGCDTVTIDKPIGEKLGTPQRQLLVGRWETSDQHMIELRWHTDGYLVGGSLSWDDKKQEFRTNNEKFEMRTIDDAVYAFMTSDGQTSFVRIEFQDDDTIRLYPPEPDQFRSAVQSGLLPGNVKEKNNRFNVVVDSSDDKTLTFFKSTDWKQYYHDDPKMTIRRREFPKSDG